MHDTIHELETLVLLCENRASEFENFEVRGLLGEFMVRINSVLCNHLELWSKRMSQEGFQPLGPSTLPSYESSVRILSCVSIAMLFLEDEYTRIIDDEAKISSMKMEQEVLQVLRALSYAIGELLAFTKRNSCGTFSLYIFHHMYQLCKYFRNVTTIQHTQEVAMASYYIYTSSRGLLEVLSNRFVLAADLLQRLPPPHPETVAQTTRKRNFATEL
jgi:hypothetical protein